MNVLRFTLFLVSQYIIHIPLFGNEGADDLNWVDDARVEWLMSTKNFHHVAGPQSAVIQIGWLRGDWQSGSLVLIWDTNNGELMNLRILSAGGPWKSYNVMKVVNEKEIKEIKNVLKTIGQIIERNIPITDSLISKVGGCSSSAGCFVIEYCKSEVFHQIVFDKFDDKPIKAEVKQAINVLMWWFSNAVSQIGKDREPPKMGDITVGRIPAVISPSDK